MSLEPQKEKLAALLKDYRDRHNLSGRAFAKKLGLNPTSLMSYLEEMTYPSAETRQRIARGIGMTPQELEAYLNDIPIKPINLLEQTIQDIRAMRREEFLVVAEVVFRRLLDESKLNS